MKLHAKNCLALVTALLVLLGSSVVGLAATSDISNLVFIQTPGTVEMNEKGLFRVEARNDAGNSESADTPLTVALSDGGGDGSFFAATAETCGDAELVNDEVTITSGSSTADFCYQNDDDGNYEITAEIETASTGAEGYADDATFGTENVWTNAYTGVWHLEEDPSAAAPQMDDSTANGYDGSTNGAMTAADSVGGQFGQGVALDNIDDFIDMSTDAVVTGAGERTMSAWYNTTNQNGAGPIVSFGGDGGDPLEDFALRVREPVGPDFRLQHWADDFDILVGPPYLDGVWHSTVTTYDGADDRFYFDGEISGSFDVVLETTAQEAQIGKWSDNFYDGSVDEVRMAETVRSAEWVSTAYTNQETPENFYTTGPSQTATSSGADWYDAGWDKRTPLVVDSEQVDDTLSDFPVYVDLSNLSADFFSDTKSDGRDIRITTADGETELPREIVSFDQQAQSGELHFKADSLAAAEDTTFYIYYGNTENVATADIAVMISPGGSGDKLEARPDMVPAIVDNREPAETEPDDGEGDTASSSETEGAGGGGGALLDTAQLQAILQAARGEVLGLLGAGGDMLGFPDTGDGSVR